MHSGDALSFDDGSGRLDALTCLEVGCPQFLHFLGNGIATSVALVGRTMGASVFGPARRFVLGKAELLHVGACFEALSTDVNVELLAKGFFGAENAEVLHGTVHEVSGSTHAFFRVVTAKASSGHVVESLLLCDELGGASNFPELEHPSSPLFDLFGMMF